MRNIVTGATGFIGRALCRELLEHKETVIAVVRPGSVKRAKLEHLIQEQGNYAEMLTIVELDLDHLYELNKKYHIQADVFYHLAWNGSSGEERDDFDIQYSNIKYTANAIKAAKACDCKKFVGAGSQAEYGVVHGVTKEDETVPHPFMMYGAAKLATYHMGRVLAEQIDIAFVWPRIYSVYGVGENPGTLVNYVIETLRNSGVPELSTCENMWNFMYITDCVRALRILGEKDGVGGIYNVASEDTRPLKEFVEEIRDIVAPDMKLGFGEKESNPERTFWLEPSIGRLRNLDFKMRVTFVKGIAQKVGKRWSKT